MNVTSWVTSSIYVSLLLLSLDLPRLHVVSILTVFLTTKPSSTLVERFMRVKDMLMLSRNIRSWNIRLSVSIDWS
jgi:hypothetical protein